MAAFCFYNLGLAINIPKHATTVACLGYWTFASTRIKRDGDIPSDLT